MLIKTITPLILGVFIALGCSSSRGIGPYRADVRQGNMLTQEMVARLQPGMSKEQVRFALGTPLVADIFHADRWDYVYLYKPGRGAEERRRVTVFFEAGRLARIEGDVAAGSVAPAPAARAD